MRIAALLAALLPLLAFGCAGPTEPLSCTIRCEEPTCELGSVPNIAVKLTNQTNSDIYLVGSLDGSDSQMRYPFCYFEVTGPDGESAVQDIPRRCGNTNTLREKDFVKVSPDERFFPYGITDEHGFFSNWQQLNPKTFRAIGEYRVRFVYNAKCDNIAAWGGSGGMGLANNEKMLAMLKMVPKVEIKSNEIKIVMIESGK